jgi:hypothetical protein
MEEYFILSAFNSFCFLASETIYLVKRVQTVIYSNVVSPRSIYNIFTVNLILGKMCFRFRNVSEFEF